MPEGVGDFVGVRVGFGVKVAWGMSVIAIVGESDGVISGVWIDASCSEVEVGSLTVSSGPYRMNNATTNTIMKIAPKIPNKISCREGRPLSFSGVGCSGSVKVIANHSRKLIDESLHSNFTPNQAYWIPVPQSPEILALMAGRRAIGGNYKNAPLGI